MENKIAKMQKSLTKFSRIVECGAVQKCVNLADRVKSFQFFLNLLFEQIANSNEYLIAKFGVDTAENGPLRVCKKVRKKVRKNIASGSLRSQCRISC